MKGYFDPISGQLTQRLNRLVRRDGELDELLHRHLGEDSSTVAHTLATHVGELRQDVASEIFLSPIACALSVNCETVSKMRDLFSRWMTGSVNWPKHV